MQLVPQHIFSYLGSFPQHELELAQSPPPDAGVPGLELGLSLVEEVDEVGGDGQQNGLGWGLYRTSSSTEVSVGLALLVSFLYHLSRRWTSLPILTSASRNISNSAVSISEGMGR